MLDEAIDRLQTEIGADKFRDIFRCYMADFEWGEVYQKPEPGAAGTHEWQIALTAFEYRLSGLERKVREQIYADLEAQWGRDWRTTLSASDLKQLETAASKNPSRAADFWVYVNTPWQIAEPTVAWPASMLGTKALMAATAGGAGSYAGYKGIAAARSGVPMEYARWRELMKMKPQMIAHLKTQAAEAGKYLSPQIWTPTRPTIPSLEHARNLLPKESFQLATKSAMGKGPILMPSETARAIGLQPGAAFPKEIKTYEQAIEWVARQQDPYLTAKMVTPGRIETPSAALKYYGKSTPKFIDPSKTTQSEAIAALMKLDPKLNKMFNTKHLINQMGITNRAKLTQTEWRILKEASGEALGSVGEKLAKITHPSTRATNIAPTILKQAGYTNTEIKNILLNHGYTKEQAAELISKIPKGTKKIPNVIQAQYMPKATTAPKTAPAIAPKIPQAQVQSKAWLTGKSPMEFAEGLAKTGMSRTEVAQALKANNYSALEIKAGLKRMELLYPKTKASAVASEMAKAGMTKSEIATMMKKAHYNPLEIEAATAKAFKTAPKAAASKAAPQTLKSLKAGKEAAMPALPGQNLLGSRYIKYPYRPTTGVPMTARAAHGAKAAWGTASKALAHPVVTAAMIGWMQGDLLKAYAPTHVKNLQEKGLGWLIYVPGVGMPLPDFRGFTGVVGGSEALGRYSPYSELQRNIVGAISGWTSGLTRAFLPSPTPLYDPTRVQQNLRTWEQIKGAPAYIKSIPSKLTPSNIYNKIYEIAWGPQQKPYEGPQMQWVTPTFRFTDPIMSQKGYLPSPTATYVSPYTITYR